MLGEQAVLDAALMDAQAIGATRYDPYPVFEDIVARNNTKGYVRGFAPSMTGR